MNSKLREILNDFRQQTIVIDNNNSLGGGELGAEAFRSSLAEAEKAIRQAVAEDMLELLGVDEILALFESYAAEREQSYKKELLSKVDRFEVIDETGRSYVKGSIYGSQIKVEMDLQDDGRTLKVFVQEDVNQTTDSVDIGTRDVNGLREGEAKHV